MATARNLKGPQAAVSPEEAVLASIRDGFHKRDAALRAGHHRIRCRNAQRQGRAPLWFKGKVKS